MATQNPDSKKLSQNNTKMDTLEGPDSASLGIEGNEAYIKTPKDALAKAQNANKKMAEQQNLQKGSEGTETASKPTQRSPSAKVASPGNSSSKTKSKRNEDEEGSQERKLWMNMLNNTINQINEEDKQLTEAKNQMEEFIIKGIPRDNEHRQFVASEIQYLEGEIAYLKEKEKEYTECAKAGMMKQTKDPKEIVRKILGTVDITELEKRLQDPHSLLKTPGLQYDYQTSDGFATALFKAFDTNFDAFGKGIRDKNTCGIPLIASGIGDGKSRALTEIPRLLQEKYSITEFTTFCVSFENGTSCSTLTPEEHIPIRILHHLAGRGGFNDFARENSKKGISLQSILEVIDQMKLLKPNVLLMVDGIHNIGKTSSETDDPMRILLREVIVGYVHSPHFIFPVCSCTASIDVLSALQDSTTQKFWIPLPMMFVIPKVNGKQIDVTEKQFRVMGGHGRSLEILQEIKEKNLEQPLDDNQLFIEVKNIMINRKSGFSTLYSDDEITALLRGSFCHTSYNPMNVNSNVKANKESKHISKYLKHGLLTVADDGRLRVAPIWLLLNTKQEDGHILQAWSGPVPVSSEEWEKFGAWFRMFLSKVHPQGETSLADFHKGMLWAENFECPNFENITVQGVIKSKGQISTKSEHKAGPIRNNNDGVRTGQEGNWIISTGAVTKKPISDWKTVVQNADNAPAGDVFLSLKSGDSIFNEVQQQKLYTKTQITKGEGPFLNFVNDELNKSVGDNDVMLFMTTGSFPQNWQETLSGKRVGVVHKDNFHEYFGPFAPFWITGEQGSRE